MEKGKPYDLDGLISYLKENPGPNVSGISKCLEVFEDMFRNNGYSRVDFFITYKLYRSLITSVGGFLDVGRYNSKFDRLVEFYDVNLRTGKMGRRSKNANEGFGGKIMNRKQRLTVFKNLVSEGIKTPEELSFRMGLAERTIRDYARESGIELTNPRIKGDNRDRIRGLKESGIEDPVEISRRTGLAVKTIKRHMRNMGMHYQRAEKPKAVVEKSEKTLEQKERDEINFQNRMLRKEKISMIDRFIRKLENFADREESTIGNIVFYDADEKLCNLMDSAESMGIDVSGYRERYNKLMQKINKANGPLYLQLDRNAERVFENYELTDVGYMLKQD